MDDATNKFDASNLHSVIAQLPTQLLRAFDFTTVSFASEVKKIFVFGMGGSALPANILKTLLANNNPEFQTPITIVRDYTLPPAFDATSAGIFISFSGNTEETISCFESAIQNNHKNLIALATGGQLKQLAEENNIPFVEIPNDCLQPRMGYGYFVAALLKILVNSNLLNFTRETLETEVQKLLDETEKFKTEGQALATQLVHKVPIIYTSNRYKYLAMVIKINFNENAKVPSFWNCFPEMNHNEMVGFTNPIGNYHIIIFRDLDDDPRLNKRMTTFQSLYQDKFPITIIDLPHTSQFNKIFSTLLLGLWTSYSLALAQGIDPTPVENVEKFKKLLRD